MFRMIQSSLAMGIGLSILVAPAAAVEAIYLDSVPITYPGEYLAPANLYLQVPPPIGDSAAGESLIPTLIYGTSVLRPSDVTTGTAYAYGYASYGTATEEDEEADRDGTKLRVLLRAGLDHASDVPLAVFRERLAEVDTIELVGPDDLYDVLVEIETMKLDTSPIVFMVINAYRQVDDEELIFYNNFGYLGEMKLLSGSSGYATKLEAALQKEAERLEE